MLMDKRVSNIGICDVYIGDDCQGLLNDVGFKLTNTITAGYIDKFEINGYDIILEACMLT
jgi:hypothetical protein